ncbi:EAL domain-containing protein [Paracoccus laeviglucosivorans]|uniref:EAL domain, c-di-GMP-specific phosphodiesterase class I (Or its enzymatically inactive variant) n=1 Tax=Paracoccus laeviglucosivorans TaxID=1197861 RepID=A0A521AHK0_9RHOB|nr:EAL domain-containing protein [Paracoccus laeviglucosivorans]SMO34253.1 EAL domain, c-di-GMP-specific phosphodiesterase class I (or its enzymatically inactive variant) [Paracoccus laeviglucosivorans]
MAYGIRSVILRWLGAGRAAPRNALVLRVENGDLLRASLGPVLLDRMVDMISRRLTTELGMVQHCRHPGLTELHGFLPSGASDVPKQLAQLGSICRRPLDLGELTVMPVINAVLISGRADPSKLLMQARMAVAASSPLSHATQVRFVEYRASDSEDVADAPPIFLPEYLRALFQPQMCCDTGRLLALRILVQIDHPQLGLLEMEDHHSRLDPAASARALRIILRQGLEALKTWDQRGLDVPFLSLPIADQDLADPATADAILGEMRRLQLPTDRLEVEVIAPIGGRAGRMPASAGLMRLAEAGCRLAFGDFGTGNGGLDDLRMFGVGRVRIGRSFTAGCDNRPDQQRMILAILALAEHLGLETLADGVTTLEERGFLSQIGFSGVQGSAVAPCMTAAQIGEFLCGHGPAATPLPDLQRRT